MDMELEALRRQRGERLQAIAEKASQVQELRRKREERERSRCKVEASDLGMNVEVEALLRKILGSEPIAVDKEQNAFVQKRSRLSTELRVGSVTVLAAEDITYNRGTQTDAIEPAPRSDEQGRDNHETHYDVICDGCGATPPLIGRVMKCADCDDFDLCSRCYPHRHKAQIGHRRGHQFFPRQA